MSITNANPPNQFEAISRKFPIHTMCLRCRKSAWGFINNSLEIGTFHCVADWFEKLYSHPRQPAWTYVRSLGNRYIIGRLSLGTDNEFYVRPDECPTISRYSWSNVSQYILRTNEIFIRSEVRRKKPVIRLAVVVISERTSLL